MRIVGYENFEAMLVDGLVALMVLKDDSWTVYSTEAHLVPLPYLVVFPYLVVLPYLVLLP